MNQEVLRDLPFGADRKLPRLSKVKLLGSAMIAIGLYIHGATIYKGVENDNWERPVGHTLVAGAWEGVGASMIVGKILYDSNKEKKRILHEKELQFASQNPAHGEFNSGDIWMEADYPIFPPIF